MQPYGEESAPAHMKGRRLLKEHERNITGLAVDASRKERDRHQNTRAIAWYPNFRIWSGILVLCLVRG